MKIGVQFQTHGVAPKNFHSATERALALGVDSVFVWDHLVPFTGTAADSAWESWSLLGSMAPVFRQSAATLGILVSPLTFRRPAILVRAAATVAALGNGRFILGVGSGGFDLDDGLAETEMTTAERLSRFTQGLQRVVEFGHEQERRHGVEIRIWVGGDGPRVTIPAAAALADGWNGLGPLERFQEAQAVLTRTLNRRTEEPRSTRQVAYERSVLLTPLDEPIDVSLYRQAGADHVIRSLRPEPNGTFDLTPIVTLLTQRANLTGDGHSQR